MIELRNKYWAVEVPQGAINIIIDMGYIIWKEPNYKNWCNDDILSDYSKLSKYLETHKVEDDYKTGGMPLPIGTWEIVCASKDIIAGNELGIIDASEFITLLASKGCDLNKTYLILKKQ